MQLVAIGKPGKGSVVQYVEVETGLKVVSKNPTYPRNESDLYQCSLCGREAMFGYQREDGKLYCHQCPTVVTGAFLKPGVYCWVYSTGGTCLARFVAESRKSGRRHGVYSARLFRKFTANGTGNRNSYEYPLASLATPKELRQHKATKTTRLGEIQTEKLATIGSLLEVVKGL